MKLTFCSLFAGLICIFVANAFAADTVPLPPIADLDAQVDFYVAEIDKNMEDLATSKDFATDAQPVIRDANALTLVALAAGMSEEKGKYKEAAPEIIKAAQAVAAIKDLDGTKKAVGDLKTALTKKSDEKLEWGKVAKMSPVMKLSVPKINTTMGRYIRTAKTLDRGIENVAGGTAALAAIAQGLGPNFDETTKPDKKDEWLKLSHDFRDAALKANAATHGYADKSVDFDTFKKAISEMKESCEHCHAVFVEGSVAIE